MLLSNCSSPAFPWALSESQTGHLTDGRSLHLPLPRGFKRRKGFFSPFSFFFWKFPFLERPKLLPYLSTETLRPQRKSRSSSY